MEDTKSWWSSTTIWASLLQMVVGIGTATGVLTGAAGTVIANEGPGLVIGVITAVLGVWSLYGRVNATKQIKA